MPTIEEQLTTLQQENANLVSANNALTAEVTGKIQAIDNEVALKSAEVDSFITTARSEFPATNLLQDSGRFAGNDDRALLLGGRLFAAPGFLTPYNGASAWSSAGEFIHDNSTNGGTAGALPQSAIDLLAAIGRVGSDASLGVEFFIGQITAGTGTFQQAGNAGHYLLTANTSENMYGSSGFLTFAAWVRAVSGSFSMPTSTGLYVDGVKQLNAVTLIPSDGFKHVKIELPSVRGFDSAAPNLGAAANSVIQLALPVVTAGRGGIGVHTAPVPTVIQ